MILPKRNKPTDADFVERQLKRTDAQALAVVPKSDEVIEPEMGLAPVSIQRQQSVTESRTESVNKLLSKAYENASNLKLSSKETESLSADFEDVDFRRGAGGKDELIYIEHQSLRRRLNEVIGIGQWSVIIRRNWTEDFLTAKREPACRVYVECVLLIRGCFIAEAIGDGTYYKSNAASNYGDAYEIAKSAVIHRVCKDCGIGLQAWNKDFCEGWKSKYKWAGERPERKK
jgi:hypothetical protein